MLFTSSSLPSTISILTSIIRGDEMSSSRINNNQSNDSSISNLTENFCLIGTPLPPLDSKKADPNELQPIWKQEVRDEQGRQRFHGAFTGGYSAGYFNTVGSKEGWTPSTFISSRSNKKDETNRANAIASGSRPEDFMDEEDLDDLREKRELKNNAGFQYDGSSGGREARTGGEDEEDPLSTLLRSDSKVPSQSIGVSILKKMGWKEGHGLGPRLTFSKRNKLLQLLGIKPLSKDDIPDSDQKQKAVFPPPDTKILNASDRNERKRNDLHGLGWIGNETLEMALNRVRNTNQGKGMGDESKGLDLDEEEGEDSSFIKSIGVYGEEDDIRNSTLNLSNKERIGLGMDNEKDQNGSKSKSKSSDDLEGIDLNKGNRWRDGREVLKGFKVSIRSQVADEWHEPPPVPPGWKPDPTRVWNSIQDENLRSSFNPQPLQSNLGPEQRANLLGEARIPGPPPSLQDYISNTQASSFVKPNSASTSNLSEVTAISIPSLDPSVASSALKGFLPFSNDQEKQKRYLDFLKSNVPGSGIEKPTKGRDQTNDQFQKELEDFVKMARVFKPMSIAMSNRFTSSSSKEGIGNGKIGNDPDSLGDLPKSGLYQPIFKDEEEEERKKKKRRIFETEEEKLAREEKEKKELFDELTPSQRAAREGRFGKETRTISQWHPNKLLCKRFNVPDPYPNQTSKSNEENSSGNQDLDSTSFPNAFGGAKGKGKAYENELSKPKVDEMWNSKKSEFKEMVQDQAWNRFSNQEGVSSSSSSVEDSMSGSKLKNAPTSLENVGLGEDENQGKDTLSYVKPSMDIFKDVFGDDDDDSDEDEDQDQEEKQNQGEQGISIPEHQAQSSTSTNQEVESKTEEESSKLIFKPKTQRTSNNEKINQVSSYGEEMEIEKAIEEEKKKPKGKSKNKSEKGNKKKSSGKGMLTFNVDDEEGEGSGSTFKLEKRKLSKDGDGKKDEGRKRQKASDLF